MVRLGRIIMVESCDGKEDLPKQAFPSLALSAEEAEPAMAFRQPQRRHEH
jgi:hypothetical protein